MKRFSALILGAAALLAAGAMAADAPKSGGLLKFAVGAEPPNYDCHAQTSFAFIHPVRPHYNTLLEFDTAKYPAIKGDLAESWTVSKDGLTYTFKLRKGVKFHDGCAFTSEDIKATYDRSASRRRACGRCARRRYADIASIETPDPLHRGVQADQAERLHALQLREPVGLRLQRGQAEAGSAVPRAQRHGHRAVHLRRARGGLALDRPQVRRLFREGQAVPQRLPRDLHRRRADGERARRGRGAGRVPRPFAGRPRPPGARRWATRRSWSSRRGCARWS